MHVSYRDQSLAGPRKSGLQRRSQSRRIIIRRDERSYLGWYAVVGAVLVIMALVFRPAIQQFADRYEAGIYQQMVDPD